MPFSMKHSLLVSLNLLALAGCAVGPDHHRPEAAVPAQFREAAGWKLAEPTDGQHTGEWWKRFGDAQLDALVDEAGRANQNIRIAEARYRQATALLGAAQAQYFPTLNSGLGVTRSQGASASSTGTVSTPARNTSRLSLTASWEADLWGRIARLNEAGAASAAAAAADLAGAQLSAQAAIVQAYLQLRINDAQHALLVRTVDAYKRSAEITRNRFDAGVAARADVTQAQAQLKTAEAQLIDLDVQRRQLEHAIAVLAGRAPGELVLAPASATPALPAVPGVLPSALLERRPDIAAAERRVAAANAQIGVAQAAFFPTLTLGASGGMQSSALERVFSLPNHFWSLGPNLALTLFDAGARDAKKAQAVAAWDETVANYRLTVQTAFQEVEDNLAALQTLEAEAGAQAEALAAAREALDLVNNQYLAGTVSYLNVTSAQTVALNAEQSLLSTQVRRLTGSVALFKAVGGGAL
ncbi:MAG: efflux transporter outer membrane subunit [Proteobacteria bacterium]|nr:efflux transporter outer membrane subunit [Pseudomonadota bacterium]